MSSSEGTDWEDGENPPSSTEQYEGGLEVPGEDNEGSESAFEEAQPSFFEAESTLMSQPSKGLYGEEFGEEFAPDELVSTSEGFTDYEQSESKALEELQGEQSPSEGFEGTAPPGSLQAASTVKEKSPAPESSRKKLSIHESDEELLQIPVPAMRPNKVVHFSLDDFAAKFAEVKYHLWPLKVLETENIFKVLSAALPRFFPSLVPYEQKSVCRKLNMLSQYIERKVYQMGHDRRKLVTIVRYHQTHWNGHKAVVRWLWCMETDGMATLAHKGEGFVVTAAVIALYID